MGTLSFKKMLDYTPIRIFMLLYLDVPQTKCQFVHVYGFSFFQTRQEFCNVLPSKGILFVGDSLTMQLFASLCSMLGLELCSGMCVMRT